MNKPVKTGDWKKAASITSTMKARYEKAVEQALLKEGHFLRAQLVTGMSSGSPGGVPYAPLSPLTLAIRRFRGGGGSKPMINTGTMRNSIVVKKIGSGAGAGIFVGILRSAKSKSGGPLANLAELHEFGKSWTQTLTPKARRFLFAALRAAGLSRPREPGAGKGTISIRIPARPTFGPVFAQYANRGDVQLRFWGNIAAGMGGDVGKP